MSEHGTTSGNYLGNAVNSLLLTLNNSRPFFNVFIVNIEQFNACGDDNNNDDNRHDEDVDRTAFTFNLILFF